MTFRIEITDRAQRDIERNAQWWAQHHSAQQAAEWFDTVHAQLQTLIEFPEWGTFSFEEVRQLRGSLNLPVERDVHFTPCPSSKITKEFY